MNEHHLSVSLLVRQAARNLHRLEVLTEHPDWTDWVCRWHFWRTRRMMAMTPDEAADWLPAVAFAVSRERNAFVLPEFARWPLPEPLPPEALPWRDRLIQVWEQYPAATTQEKTIRLAALVRLDRRAERLPEWLHEARQAMDIKPENRRLRLAALAALAGWRPRPGDGPPHGGKAEAAQAWVRFWEERYRTPGSEPDGLIAATALLHLAEAGWLPSGPSPERLQEEVRRRVQQWKTTYQYRLLFQMALASVPAGSPSPEQKDITGWLELTHENVQWEKREVVWDMLAAWQRERILERSGRGRLPEPPLLLPDLARALKWERNNDVLRAMAGYIPGAVEVSTHPEAARAVVARWEALSRSDNWRTRREAWVVRWNFLRAGVLTTGEQGRFDTDYMEAIGAEDDRDVLLALAQITPPGTFPLAIWTRLLSDQGNWHRLAARLAIHGWLVDMTGGGQRRQVRQVLRRAGQDIGDGTVAPFINLPPEVWPDFRRLRGIETALAAGHLPPPPDAAAENRATPRAVPARLPEADPQTGPPGITDRTTGRTAGSEPPARHLFPEVIRHE